MNKIIELKDNKEAIEGFRKLQEGNLRFVKNWIHRDNLSVHEKRDSLTGGQKPFAIILSCSDSRVPSEIVFDQTLGDLFVIRVAGNIVAPSLVGSVEFAAVTFGVPLVVVMGHSRCGAVIATYDSILSKSPAASENIHDIVDRISPSVHQVMDLHPNGMEKAELIEKCIGANVRNSVQHLRHGSRILEDLYMNNKIKIIGANYSLDSGEVYFFE